MYTSIFHENKKGVFIVNNGGILRWQMYTSKNII